MTMSSPVGITLVQPIPVPTLTVLPPSSDTESWSRSPSPRASHSSSLGKLHRSRIRTKKRNKKEQGCTPKQLGIKNTQAVMPETMDNSHLPSPFVAQHIDEEEQGQDSLLQDLLLPPSRSWSHSPSPSRRSRWSLKSLLSRDGDWESCRLVSWIHHNSRAQCMIKCRCL